MKLTDKQLLMLKRKRGELNLTIGKISTQVGVSRYTISDLLKNKRNYVTKETAEKIDNWLLDQLEK